MNKIIAIYCIVLINFAQAGYGGADDAKQSLGEFAIILFYHKNLSGNLIGFLRMFPNDYRQRLASMIILDGEKTLAAALAERKKLTDAELLAVLSE